MLTILAAIAILSQDGERPGVEVVLVVPPGSEPWPDAQQRLDPALKDVQWWYSCQMEAYGYGPKTFALELDAAGKVVIHVARLKEPIEMGKGMPPPSIMPTAESVVGDVRSRHGTVMLVYYTDYYWENRQTLQALPAGLGLNGRWASLNAWHFFSLNPAGWSCSTPVPKLPINNPYFPPFHTQALQAFGGDGSRTVAERTSVGYGSIMHEIGHAFGLHHPDPKNHPRGDVMAGEYWKVRGNFVQDYLSEWCCLSPGDAAVLDKNPLFQVRKDLKASTGAARAIGMRGAVSR